LAGLPLKTEAWDGVTERGPESNPPAVGGQTAPVGRVSKKAGALYNSRAKEMGLVENGILLETGMGGMRIEPRLWWEGGQCMQVSLTRVCLESAC